MWDVLALYLMLTFKLVLVRFLFVAFPKGCLLNILVLFRCWYILIRRFSSIHVSCACILFFFASPSVSVVPVFRFGLALNVICVNDFRTGEVEANKKMCMFLPLRSGFFFILFVTVVRLAFFHFQSNIEIGKYIPKPNVANMINERNGK